MYSYTTQYSIDEKIYTKLLKHKQYGFILYPYNIKLGG